MGEVLVIDSVTRVSANKNLEKFFGIALAVLCDALVYETHKEKSVFSCYLLFVSYII